MMFSGKKWIFATVISALAVLTMGSSVFCETLSFPEEYSDIMEAIYASQPTVNTASQKNTISLSCGDCHSTSYMWPHHDYYEVGSDPDTPYNPYRPDPPTGCAPCHFYYDENCQPTQLVIFYGMGCGLCHTFGTCSSDVWQIPSDCFVSSIDATIDIDPDTLNLKSNANWMRCYIELPEDYDVGQIDIATVQLSVGGTSIDAALSPTEVGDYDSDDIPDLMVEFDRQAVQEAILDPGSVVITASGSLIDGTQFRGTITALVLEKGRHQ